jgi:hypothetical protein
MTHADQTRTVSPNPLAASVASQSDYDLAAISRSRQLLGAEAEGLSDAQMIHISRHADAMARVLVEMFLARAA